MEFNIIYKEFTNKYTKHTINWFIKNALANSLKE